MEFTAEQIAALAGGTVEGNPQARIATVAKIEEGREGAISFLANPKYEHFIYTTASSAVLVRRDFVPEREVAATLIRVDDPYATMARLLAHVSALLSPKRSGVAPQAVVEDDAEVAEGAWVGPLAYVGHGAKIGKGAQVYPQAYVGDGAVVGDDTTIYAGAKIYTGCHIGRRCIIHAGAVVGADGFGFAPLPDGSYEKIPQIGIVEIGDDVELGANTCIDRATMGATRIADGVKLDNLIQVAHNCSVGANTVMASQTGVAGSTKIGAGCVIAGQVGFVGHIEIGDRVTIGAQAGVNKSTASGSRIMGYPASDFGSWARLQALLKKLPALYADVATLKKEIKPEKI